MNVDADSVRITCTSCGAAIAAATRFCAGCGAEQPGRECPQCRERVIISARFCGACGCPTALEEAWVALVNAYDLVVDRFVDDRGVEQEQQIRARTVRNVDGVRQVPEATRVLLTAGIEKAIEEGRLVRVPEPTSEADSAVSAPTEVPSSSLTGDWRRDLVHAFGLGDGPGVRQMQDAVAPESVLGVAAVDEGARLPRDPRTSLPREFAPDEHKW
jgi:hypothetical protein